MRSKAVLGMVLSVGTMAACGGGDAIRAPDRPPPALSLERTTPRLVRASGDGAGSSLALARLDGRRLALVADADSHAVRLLDTRSGEELPQLDLPGEPAQLVVGGDGRVFVSLRDEAEVDVLEPTTVGDAARFTLRVADRITTAEEPVGLSLTPDGRTLLVACGWGRVLDAFSTRTLAHAFRTPVAREPRAVVTSADGRLAYVSHATASVVSVVDLMSPDHEVRAQRLEQPDGDGHPGKLAWRQGFALARAELGILAPGVEANTGDTTVRSETYGGIEATSMPAEQFSVSVIDEERPPPGLEAPRTLDAAFTECLLPRAAAYDAQGEWLVVACAGKDTVMRLEARAGKAGGQQAEWKVGAEPSGVALDEERREGFVWSQGARTLTSFPLDGYHPNAASPDPAGLVRTVGLGERVGEPDLVAKGRALFHTTGDARISSDGRACASCHPDGRDDGLVWATPDGPRQTPTLAGRLAGTAPYGWNGSRGTVKKHVTSTLKRLGGSGLEDDAMDALVAYCMAMKAPPRAALEASEDLPLVEEGKDIFESSSAGCSSCHMSDGTFTDGNRHNVGSKAKGDPRRSFDTPSLKFLSGTGPYFHDGRYPTIRAVLLGSDGKMGHTAQLSPHQIDALEAYLQTL
jgi:mono/diheme cytochrome c family protein